MTNPQGSLPNDSRRSTVGRMSRKTPLARYLFENDLSMAALAAKAQASNVTIGPMTISRIANRRYKALAVLARLREVTGLTGDQLLGIDNG